MLMRAFKTRHHACPRPRTAYKMAAELLREEDKREKPDQPVPPTTTPKKKGGCVIKEPVRTPYVEIVQGYLSRVQRSLESVKRRSFALAEAWSCESSSRNHQSSLQFCNRTSHLFRGDLFPVLFCFVPDSGRIGHLFVNFVGDGAIDSRILVGREFSF